MASYEQCVKFESEKPQGVVRLVEANGFYRAYNHSAAYGLRKVLVAKSGLLYFGRVSADGLRFYPDALEWRRFGLKKTFHEKD